MQKRIKRSQCGHSSSFFDDEVDYTSYILPIPIVSKKLVSLSREIRARGGWDGIKLSLASLAGGFAQSAVVSLSKMNYFIDFCFLLF